MNKRINIVVFFVLKTESTHESGESYCDAIEKSYDVCLREHIPEMRTRACLVRHIGGPMISAHARFGF